MYVAGTDWTWNGSSWVVSHDSIISFIGMRETYHTYGKHQNTEAIVKFLDDEIISHNPPPRANYTCDVIFFDDSDPYTNMVFCVDDNLYSNTMGVVCVNDGGTKKWKYIDDVMVLIDGTWRNTQSSSLKVGLWQDVTV